MHPAGRCRFLPFLWTLWWLIVSICALHAACMSDRPAQLSEDAKCQNLVGNGANEWIANTNAIDAVGGDVQILVDCVPPKASLLFDVDLLPLERALKLKKAIHIGRVNPWQNPQLNVTCPENGSAITVRSKGVRLSDLSFAKCGSNGASILTVTPGSNATVWNSVFRDNVNIGGPGCISVENATLGLFNSSFSGNKGTRGGVVGLTGDASLHVWGSAFTENFAREGGAVFANSSDVKVVASTFAVNSAKDAGRAVYAEASRGRPTVLPQNDEFHTNVIVHTFESVANGSAGGAIAVMGTATCSIEGSKFVNNSAIISGGAVVFENSSELVVSNTSFRHNNAFVGGALALISPLESNTMVQLRNVTFEGNVAKGEFKELSALGGAVHAFGIAGLEMERCTLANNTADGAGGGVYLSSVNSSSIVQTTFTTNYAHGACGGLCARAEKNPAALTITDVVFESNWVDPGIGKGGATGLVGRFQSMFITRGLFRNNTADEAGAVFVEVQYGVPTDRSDFMEDFDAPFHDNGIKFVGPDSLPNVLTVVDSLFEGNHGRAVTLDGGNASCIFADTIFTGNYGQKGGAIQASGDESAGALMGLDIRDVSFLSNNAIETQGGAMHLVANVMVTVQRAVFENNTAVDKGGALYVNDRAWLNIREAKFLGNTAGTMGGAAAFDHINKGEENFQIRENMLIWMSELTFIENRVGIVKNGETSLVPSLSGRGGAIAILGTGTIVNMTRLLIQNCTSGAGGAISWQDGGDLEARDIEIVSNHAAMGGGMHAGFSEFPGRFFKLSDMVFSDNDAQRGGALVLTDTVHLFETLSVSDLKDAGRNATLLDMTFSSNTGSEEGGAVVAEGVLVQCENCIFESNKAVSEVSAFSSVGVGGGLSVGTNAVVELNGSRFKSNKADQGGAIRVSDGAFYGTKVSFLDNRARDVGGALSLKDDAAFSTDDGVLSNCKWCNMKGNRARIGGAVHVSVELPSSRVLGLCYLLNNTQELSQMPKPAMFSLARTCQSSPNFVQALENRRVKFEDTVLANNKAEESASTLFSNRLWFVEWCCGSQCNRLSADYTLKPCSGMEDSGSQEQGENSTSVVASIASKVSLEPDRIDGHSSGEPLPPVQIMLKDALDQVVTGESSLVVKNRRSGILSGNPVAGILLESGNYTVTGIVLRANSSSQPYNLTFKVTCENLGDVSLSAVLPVFVRECSFGEEWKKESKQCLKCDPEEFSFDASEGCKLCPDNAKCNGSTLVPLEGFWHASSISETIQECMIAHACKRGDRTDDLSRTAFQAHLQGQPLSWENTSYRQCAQGYAGPLCGSCSPEHGRSGELECGVCPGKAVSILVLISTGLVLLVLSSFMTRSTLKHAKRLDAERKSGRYSVSSSHQQRAAEMVEIPLPPAGEPMSTRGTSSNEEASKPNQAPILATNRTTEVFKILLNFLQVVGTAVALNVHWTESVFKLLSMTDVVSGMSSESGLSSMDCAFDASRAPRSIQSYLFQSLLPFAVWISLVMYWIVCTMVRKWTIQKLLRRMLVGFLVVMYISYTTITKKVVRTFNCTDVELPNAPTSKLWLTDTSVECYKGAHVVLVVTVAWPLLVGICVGYPLGLILELRSNKDILNDADYAASYGFLYKAYKSEAIFWEALVLLRKGGLATITAFSQALGPELQGSLALALLLCAFVLHKAFEPYDEIFPRLNLLESLSLLITIITFLCGSMFLQSRGHIWGQMVLTIVVLSSVGGFSLYLLYELFLSGSQSLEEWLKGEGVTTGSQWYNVKAAWGLISTKASDSMTKLNTELSSRFGKNAQ